MPEAPDVKVIDNPLAIDKETIKKLGITEDIDLSPVQKLSFLQDQLSEMKVIMWRSRVDIIHAKRLAQSDTQALRNKGLQRETEHQNEVEQFLGGARMLVKMIEQLREEYPELKVEG